MTYTEHLVPDESEPHPLSPDCACQPFVYLRYRDDQVVGTEYRHNSFEALPVDEQQLEAAQAGEGLQGPL